MFSRLGHYYIDIIDFMARSWSKQANAQWTTDERCHLTSAADLFPTEVLIGKTQCRTLTAAVTVDKASYFFDNISH